MVDYAADFIRRGRVVGMPTDTFYALSADPFNLSSIEHVFRVKGRAENKALPILVNSIEQAVTLARDLPDSFLVLAHKFWPGALTLVVEATHRLPLKVTGNTGRVALRWPDSRIASALIEAVHGPITGTSANLSGFPSCTNASQIVKQLGERLAADSRFRRHWRDHGFDHCAHKWKRMVNRTRRRNSRIGNPRSSAIANDLPRDKLTRSR